MAHQYPSNSEEGHPHFSTQPPPPGQAHGVQPHQANPPQTLQQPGGSRTLHIYSDGMWSKNVTILDADNTTPLYTAETHSISTPNVTIRSSATSAVVGTVRFRSFSQTIELEINGQSVALESRGVFKPGFTYRSPTSNGAELTWKKSNVMTTGNLVCLDEKEMPVAKYEAKNWSKKQWGSLELVGFGAKGGPAMDEIVVSAIAMAEYRRRQQGSSAGGGAGS